MSRENIEALRSFYESGSPDLLEADPQVDQAFRDFLDEDFEVRWPPTWPEGEQVFRGREGVAQLFCDAPGDLGRVAGRAGAVFRRRRPRRGVRAHAGKGRWEWRRDRVRARAGLELSRRARDVDAGLYRSRGSPPRRGLRE